MSNNLLKIGRLPLNKKYFASARNVSKHNFNEQNVKTGRLPQNKNFFVSVHSGQPKAEKDISSAAKNINKNGGQKLKQTICNFLHKMLENFADNVENIGKLYKMK